MNRFTLPRNLGHAMQRTHYPLRALFLSHFDFADLDFAQKPSNWPTGHLLCVKTSVLHLQINF